MAASRVKLLGGRMGTADARLSEALDAERGRANRLAVQLRDAEEKLADLRLELAGADAEIRRLTDALNERTAPLPVPAGPADLPPASGDLEPAVIHRALLGKDAYASLRADGGVYAR